jgi:thyrotrophic embryonic factor
VKYRKTCLFQAYVPLESKDNKYWEKRNKNNVAARRSREARRLKENQIALRTAFLERENANLRNSLDEVKTENKGIQCDKSIFEKVFI